MLFYTGELVRFEYDDFKHFKRLVVLFSMLLLLWGFFWVFFHLPKKYLLNILSLLYFMNVFQWLIFDRELGKQAQEERMKIQKMQMEGFGKKQEFINEGNAAIEEKKVSHWNVILLKVVFLFFSFFSYNKYVLDHFLNPLVSWIQS